MTGGRSLMEGHDGSGVLGVFRHRSFASFWLAGLASNTGTWLHIVTSSILVFAYTQSAGALGLLGLIAYLPLLLFTLPAGVLTDQFDRRQLIVATHLGAAVVVGLLAAAVHAGMRSVESIAAVAFVVYTTYALSKPALSAIFPSLVDRAEIPQATAINSLSFVLGQFLGPLLSSVLIAAGAPAVGFALNAASYLAVAVVVARLPRPTALAPKSSVSLGSFAAALGESLRHAARNRHLRTMLVVVALVSPLPEVLRLLAPAVVDQAGASAGTAGLVGAAIGAGGAIGLLVVARFHAPVREPRSIIGGCALSGLAALVAATAGSSTVLLVASLAVGLGYGVVFATATASIQSTVEEVQRGRVMSVHTLAHLGTRPLFTPIAGWLAASIGVAVAIIGFAALLPIAILEVVRDASRETSERPIEALDDRPA